MPHIHTRPGEHDATASAYIIRTDTDEPQILLHRHKKLHTLLQPGGHIELLETPWQAVLHEIVEETGYALSQLKVLQPATRMKRLSGAVLHPQSVGVNTHAFDGQHFHTDAAFAFLADGPPVGMPAEDESAELYWFTEQQLMALPETDIYRSTQQIAQFVLGVILQEWEPVELREFEA